VAPEVKFARSSDVSIAYSVAGEGTIDLLYLSTYSNLDLFGENPLVSGFLRELSSMARLIVSDRRGQGVSDRLSPADVPLLEDNIDDVIAVLDAVRSQRVVLMGTDEMGALCALLAGLHPKRVAGLILFGAAACYVQKPDYPWQWGEEEWTRYLDDVRENWGTREFARRTLPLFCPSLSGNQQHLDWWERFLRGVASGNVQVAIENAMRQMDIRPHLPTVAVPTLILHRVGDLVEPVGAGRYLAEAIRGAEYVELDGEDHFPWAGDQEPVLMEIERFIRSLGGGSRGVVDRVLTTVMFTDIVDSTAHAANLGDRRWREARAEHDRIVRDRLELFRGHEVKTMGDGFLATFDGPARGVLCASEICASTRALGIEIRAGLHTGEIELDGSDISGIAVAIGARVGALARPGEVLVSSTVKDLVAGSGLAFDDRGPHVLKGVPGEWRLYAATFPT